LSLPPQRVAEDCRDAFEYCLDDAEFDRLSDWPRYAEKAAHLIGDKAGARFWSEVNALIWEFDGHFEDYGEFPDIAPGAEPEAYLAAALWETGSLAQTVAMAKARNDSDALIYWRTVTDLLNAT